MPKRISTPFNAAATRIADEAGVPVFNPAAYPVGGNCYTYAMNRTDGVSLHPGQLSPGEYSYAAFYAVDSTDPRKYHRDFFRAFARACRAGAEKDGLEPFPIPHRVDAATAQVPQDRYLTALSLRCCRDARHRYPWPDYHWFRRDADSLWSYKKGQDGPIDRRDQSGRVIADPRRADLGLYSFAGFFLAPKQV